MDNKIKSIWIFV